MHARPHPAPLHGRRTLLLAAAAGPLVLAGCASKKPPPPNVPPPASAGLFKPAIASMGGDIVAAANLNPSATGRPSPLALRVFELSAATAFNKADFMPLWQADLTTLGEELLAREEVFLAPGETRPLQKVLNADTRFVGVFGVFREFQRATWRAIAPVTPGKQHRLSIRADSLAVAIQLQAL